MKKNFKMNAALVFLIVLQLFTSISFGQEKRFSEEYIKKNIKDRGFVNHKYLTSNEKTDFFYAEEPRGPKVLAINNISRDAPVVNLKKVSVKDNYNQVKEVGEFSDYENENLFYKTLVRKIAETKPEYYSKEKYISIYQYVKDFVFGTETDGFYRCDVPICKIGVRRNSLEESSEWNLDKRVYHIYEPIHYDAAISVNHALEKGRMIYSSQNVEGINPANIYIDKSQLIKNGFIFHDDTFWKKSWLWDYPDKGIFSSMAYEAAMDYRTNTLKHIFQGNFEKIQKQHNIKEYIVSFLFTYSKHCEDYLGDYEHFKLTRKTIKQNNYGAFRGSWTEDLGSIKVPLRFVNFFNKTYSDYSYVELCLKDMEDIIIKLGCDCKEVNQLEENLYQLSQNKSSIQKLNKPPKGEECYFD